MSNIDVLSFNIRNACDKGTESWESRRSNLVKLIKDVNPDLIGLQEVLHSQYIDLVEDFPEYSFVGVGRDDGKTEGEYASILYKKERFSYISSDNFWLSETPDKPSFGWDAVCIRICTSVKLYDTHTKKYFIHFNTHLDHEGKTAMAESAKLIKKEVKIRQTPAFITGDFNVYEKSEPYNIMSQEGLCDAKFNAKSSMTYGTFHAYNPSDSLCNESPIDYLFYTENDFDIDSYKVLVNGKKGEFTSDHYPILISLLQR